LHDSARPRIRRMTWSPRPSRDSTMCCARRRAAARTCVSSTLETSSRRWVATAPTISASIFAARHHSLRFFSTSSRTVPWTRHPHMLLQDRHFIVKRVNWDDKPANIRAIAESLNIGLESIVFLDDSDFECSAVRAQLPMVRTFQVPKTLSSYPRVLEDIKSL